MSGIVIMAIMAHAAFSAAPTPAELQEAQQWAAAEFVGTPLADVHPSGLEVLKNHDPVQLNSRGGDPLNIHGVEYKSGLYCHAESEVVVRLPKPAMTFSAVVGVDSNSQTNGGRGSVVFSVVAKDKELWKSETLHEGAPAVPVSVDLGGVFEFVLKIGDAGDGISCDQGDWANAKVALEGGQTIALGELALIDHSRAPYSTAPFISFNYDGKPSSEFLSKWDLKRDSRKLNKDETEYTLTYVDPETKLEVRCVGVAYADFPTVEWTVYFKNGGSSDSPIISDIQAIDTNFDRPSSTEFVLHGNKGDDCTADSFEPYQNPLPQRTDKRIANTGGRPTQISFPYFNIAAGNEGMIFVVSWAGQWSAQFNRDDATNLRLRAGQEITHFKLNPGEEVRGPMIVLQFWKGDVLHAQNVWRAWMIEHNIPRPGGKLPPVPELAACSSHQFGEMINANNDNQISFVDKYLERGLKLDYWWMDAGWYPNKTGWPNTGTWEVDENRFPGGLKVITDHAHEKGVNSIVWFEPERVTAGTWLTENHPEWILGGKDGGLLNLGNPEALAWLTDHINNFIDAQGIDLYRQDFNIDPLSFWRKNDAEDRQGITEIRHIEGYFAYWDGLKAKHPNMLIDSCASGGRRNDLETLRRAVPLLRSDYIMEPTGNQCHTYTLASWFPFYGTGSSATSSYMIRSTLCPHFTACWDQRKDDIDWADIKRIVDQWKAFAPYYFGDFYPLTAYSLANDQWIGWQFDRPDLGEGILQFFRRPDSIYESARPTAKALDPNAHYNVVNLDAPDAAIEMTGKEIMEKGVSVQITERPGSAFITYKIIEK
jgi:alpha-galactosidase